MTTEMLRLGAVAAVLFACAGAALATQGRSAAGPVHHSCGLTDHQFISSYALEIASVNLYHSDWVQGVGSERDLEDASREASRVMRRSGPTDPTLHRVKKLASSMFLAYADAVHERAHGDDDSRDMDSAYTIQTHVQNELRRAEPGLARIGCSVAELLQ
jgi:hypothetical protein